MIYNKMVKIVGFIMVLVLMPKQTINAQSYEIRRSVEDGGYYTTEINIENNSDVSVFSTSDIKTASKTLTYRRSSGEALWYVKVTGTFSYDGITSVCTASSVTAGSYDVNWKISSKSSSKSGNTAKGTATGKCYFDTTVVQTITKTVSLTCSKTGQFS